MVEFIDKLCVAMRSNRACDLFLLEGAVPQIRLEGKLMDFGNTAITTAWLRDFWIECGAPEDALDFDTAFTASDNGRFRVNLYRSLGRRGAVLREIKTLIPELETLHLPAEVLGEWITRPAGLVLIAGRTGSGKSTTIASSLQWLNLHFARHVITIEDPIEYLFHNQACHFSQREIGIDTDSFAQGLRRSLRQSPDVIFVGEVRDYASAATVLQAAETGHLVITTLHSANVGETIERFIQLFPAADREGARHILASQLVGILCQQLIAAKDGSQVPVLEYLQNEGLSRKHIQEGRSIELSDLLSRTESASTARSFLTSFVQLVESATLDQDSALQFCEKPHELRRALRGISSGSIVKT